MGPLLSPTSLADKLDMEARWVFTRGDERLELKRGSSGDCVQLVVTLSNEPPRIHHFSDLVALTRFQADMEQVLVWTGWTFVEFFPERRGGRDRRHMPRLEERRRWWTDGKRPETSPAPAHPRIRRRGRRRR